MNANCNSRRIAYHMGDVCFSKEELFRHYFTDFYDYLREKYPDSGVRDYTLQEFLSIANDWKYGKGSMTGLANLFHPYYLVVETDGLLENQSDAGFIGYCYKQNKYRSFIRFLIAFFAYWRTDEEYTTKENHGNDFFYSSWASLVDTCKFFFLTADTLFGYQRTSRLLDCFRNPDSVVDMSGLPQEAEDVILPDVKRRGYVFEGWYTDSDYRKKITTLTDRMVNLNLYPKWRKATCTVTYQTAAGVTLKSEQYEYQDYVTFDQEFTYPDQVENQNTIRVLKFTQAMPIINDIIAVKK